MIESEHLQWFLAGFFSGFGLLAVLEVYVIPAYARWLVRAGRVPERRRERRAAGR